MMPLQALIEPAKATTTSRWRSRRSSCASFIRNISPRPQKKTTSQLVVWLTVYNKQLQLTFLAIYFHTGNNWYPWTKQHKTHITKLHEGKGWFMVQLTMGWFLGILPYHLFLFFSWCTPWKFNIDPENKPSQKEIHLPTLIFQGLG